MGIRLPHREILSFMAITGSDENSDPPTMDIAPPPNLFLQVPRISNFRKQSNGQLLHMQFLLSELVSPCPNQL